MKHSDLLRAWVLRFDRWRRSRRELRRAQDPVKALAAGLRNRVDGKVERRRDLLVVTAAAGTIVVPTRRILCVARFRPDRLEMELVHHIAEVDRALHRGGLVAYGRPLARRELVPVLIAADRVERAGSLARVTVRLDGGPQVAFALGGPTTNLWCTRADAARWGWDAAALMRVAADNLDRRSDQSALRTIDGGDPCVFTFSAADELNGARLLLPSLWESVSLRCGSALVLAAPTRDRIYAAPTGNYDAVANVVERTMEDWLGRPHAVSPTLWTWQRDRIVPWHRHA